MNNIDHNVLRVNVALGVLDRAATIPADVLALAHAVLRDALHNDFSSSDSIERPYP